MKRSTFGLGAEAKEVRDLEKPRVLWDGEDMEGNGWPSRAAKMVELKSHARESELLKNAMHIAIVVIDSGFISVWRMDWLGKKPQAQSSLGSPYKGTNKKPQRAVAEGQWGGGAAKECWKMNPCDLQQNRRGGWGRARSWRWLSKNLIHYLFPTWTGLRLREIR